MLCKNIFYTQSLLKFNKWTRDRLFLLGAFLVGIFIPLTMNAHTSPYVRLTLGDIFAQTGQNQVIAFDPSYWKKLVTNHNSVSEIYGGISAGLRIPFNSIWAIEIGAGYYQAASLNQEGKIYQYNSPDFYNLNYDYKIQIRRVMFEGKLLTTFSTIYHPYLSAGIGASRNRSYNYQETPVQPYAVPDPSFASWSQNNFSCSAGIGLDIEVTQHWRIGAGYEYSNLGTAKLGRSPVQMTSQQVSSGTINTNQVLAQVSYTI